MSVLMFCFYVLLLLLLSWLWNVHKTRKTFPPGPFPLPIVGNLLQMDPHRPANTILKWSNKYGPVITVWMAKRPFVMITDYELMKDALLKHGDQLSSRVKQVNLDGTEVKNSGIPFMSGAVWKEQRRFSLHTLRNFGLGKNLMEHRVMAEASKMCAWIEDDLGKENGKSMDISPLVELCIGNIISSVLLGHSFDQNDPEFAKAREVLKKHFALIASRPVRLLNSFPWLRHVPPFKDLGVKKLKAFQDIFAQFLQNEIEQHKLEMKCCDPNEEPKDFIMAYLNEIENRKRRGEETSSFSESQLLLAARSLWVAGLETTVTTLRWGILAMMVNPDIQRKVQQEIDKVIGDHRPPGMSDLKEMPYVTATINEMQRWGNIVPINISHTNDVDFQLAGYTIPAGVPVVPQISALNIDPKVFPSPEIFDPERFLANNNKIDQFAPFSMGKRQCLGEAMARTELFLVFVSIMRRYNLSIVPGEAPPSLLPLVGATSSPAKFQCFVTRR